MALVDRHRELLRRLTLNDERALSDLVSGGDLIDEPLLDGWTRGLVRIAALAALDAQLESLQAARDAALAAGASDEEILASVVAVAPIVGTARIASVAPRLAVAMDNG